MASPGSSGGSTERKSSDSGSGSVTPVIIAADGGAPLFPLCSCVCKALLPLLNFTLLHYQCALLAASGFTEVIVASPAEAKPQIDAFVEGAGAELTIKIVSVAIEGDAGTADVLRKLAPMLKGDFLVMAGDAVIEGTLHKLVDAHRLHGAPVSILFKEMKPVLPTKEGLVKRPKPVLYAGVREKTGQVAVLRAAAAVGSALTVPKFVMSRCPDLCMRVDLEDVHVFMCSHSVLKLLQEHDDLPSFQEDFLPMLVPSQFDAAGDSRLVFAHIIPHEGLVAERVLTREGFLKLAMSLLRKKPERGVTHWGRGRGTYNAKAVSLCGNDTVLPKDTKMKSTVLGSSILIGGGCTLEGCVIMDGAVIGDGCTIVNSVIGSKAVVGKGSTIEGSFVGHGSEVEEGAALTDTQA